MKAEDIFLAALEKKTPAERRAYLDSACRDDPGLRAQVESLLQSHQEAGSFLDAPLFDSPPTVDQPVVEKPGTSIGPYKLLQQIGEGGFGVVFMAEQSQPVRRRVALKVIKPGMDTRQVIARFEAERQALAMMDHPNIARVMDAGATASGRPYFVMELVRGVPITAYCDQNNLPIRERLALFASVCGAIQHAHQKGIIHRDIKPSNVLVTSQDGVAAVKVIDFGVAKAMGQQLTDKTLFTDFAQMIGTPLYMSPEQAELSGNDIDTRSDIYSLGVMLYELLTGSTPVDKEQMKKAAFDEIRRIIREEEPPKPSTRISSAEAAPSIAAQRHTEPARLARLVRGELDWIVMKSLEKDRNRRYETANAFARDVEHFLNDEPVLACPPSASYRLRKFARRNKAALATAAIIASALVLGFAVSTWQAIRATRAEKLAGQRLESEKKATALATASGLEAIQQKKKAETNATEAQVQRLIAEQNFVKARTTVDDYFVRVSESHLLKAAGLQPLRRELLEAALKFYEELTKLRSNDPVLQTELAGAHYRVGRIHSELGSRDEAQKAFGRAQDLYEILLKDRPADVDLQHGRARCQFWGGKSAEAVASWEKLVKQAAVRADIQRELADAYNSVAIDVTDARKNAEAAGNKAEAAGNKAEAARNRAEAALKLAEAVQWHEKARFIREQLAATAPDDVEIRYALGQTLNNIANLLPWPQRDTDALALYRRALEHGTFAFDRAPQKFNYGRLVAVASGNMAKCETRLGSPQALESYQKSIGVWKKLALDNPLVPSLNASLVQSYRELAAYQKDLGRTEEWTRTIRLSQQVLERFPQQSATDLYNFACLHAVTSALSAKDSLTATAQERTDAQKEVDREAKEAVDALDRAVKAGFSDLVLLQLDKDLDSLRSRDDFQQVLTKLDDTLKSQQVAKAEQERGAKFGELAKAAAQGASPESLQAGQALLDIQKSLANEKPERLDRQADVAATQHTIGLIQLSLDQLDEAAKSLAEAEATRQVLVTKEPNQRSHQADLAATRLALGDLDWKAGRLAEGAARWRQALEQLESVMAAEPENNRCVSQLAAATSAIANSYGEIGLWREAAAHYAKAFAAQPSGNSYNWVPVGNLSLWAGDQETYRLFCTQALERSKGNIDKRMLSDLTCCICLSPEPLIESARLVEMAKEVLAVEPTHGWRRFRVGLAQYRAGQYQEALATLEGYMGFSENWPLAAMIYHRLGQPARAREELAKCDRQIEKLLRDTLAADSLNFSQYAWGHWILVQTLRREAHALIDGRPFVAGPLEHLQLARAYARLGKKEQSDAEFQVAVDLGAGDLKSQMSLVSVLDQLGRHELAEAAFERACALAPTDPAPYFDRARYQIEHGRLQQAEALLAKAATITPDELNKFVQAGWWVDTQPAGGNPADATGPLGKLPPAEPAAATGAAPATVPIASPRWRQARALESGHVDLASIPDVKAQKTAHAVCYVYSPETRSATILVGSKNRVRLEVNGELVYEGVGRDWEWNLNQAPVLLRAGRNTLVATVDKPDQWAALVLRIADSRFDRAWLLAQLGLFDEALPLFKEQFAEAPPDAPWVWYQYAGLLVAQGDIDACRRLRGEMGKREFPDYANPAIYDAAMAALAPVANEDQARLAEMAAQGVAKDKGSDLSFPFLQTRAYYRLKRYTEALGLLEKAAQDPKSSWASGQIDALLALCHHALGNAGQARTALEKADRWCNDLFQPQQPGGSASLFHRHWSGFVEFNQTLLLVREAHRVVAGDTPQFEAQFADLTAHIRSELAKSDKGSAAFDRAILMDQSQPRLWLGRFRARTAAGQTELAERELQQLVIAAPDREDGRQRRGLIYAGLGRVEPAAADLVKALAMMPASDGWSGGPKRRLCAQLAEWPMVFERVAALLKGEDALWCGRAAWHSQHNRWKEAADDYSRSSDLIYFDEFCNYAGLCLLMGDEQRYAEMCRRFLDRMGQDAWGSLHRAKICILSANPPAEQSQVIAWAEAGLKIEKKQQGLALLAMGLAWYRAGEWQRAIPELQQAAREWKQTPVELQQTELVLAMCEYKLGNTDQAQARLKKASALIDQAAPHTSDNPFAIHPRNWISLNLLRREAEALILAPAK